MVLVDLFADYYNKKRYYYFILEASIHVHVHAVIKLDKEGLIFSRCCRFPNKAYNGHGGVIDHES